MILSLDTGTKTGWCLWDKGKVIESGVQDFTKRRGESNGAMFLRFRYWLREIVQKNHVTFVVYESAHHRGGATTEICINLTGRVQEHCTSVGIEYTSIHSGTLKKYATGHGDAGKPAMIKAAKAILKRKPADDNEADAVLMAKWASENYEA